MRRPRLGPRQVEALRALSRVRYTRPASVPLPVLQRLHELRLAVMHLHQSEPQVHHSAGVSPKSESCVPGGGSGRAGRGFHPKRLSCSEASADGSTAVTGLAGAGDAGGGAP